MIGIHLPYSINEKNVNYLIDYDTRAGDPPCSALECVVGYIGKTVRRVVKALLRLGARITNLCLQRCFCPRIMRILLDSGGCALAEFTSGKVMRRYHPFVKASLVHVLMDYGAWLCPSKNTTDSCKHSVAYYPIVQRRIANCRRTLVALLYYCRRSAYPALRAGYMELAKWILCMRGGGERCSLRSSAWTNTK